MGAFGRGFLSGIGDAVHQKAAQHQANEQAQKQAEAQYHWGALQHAIQQGGRVDPTTGKFVPYTPEDINNMVQQTTENMGKSYGGSKPVKALMQNVQQLIGKATGHPLWGHPGSENMPQQSTPSQASGTQQTAMGVPAPPNGSANAMPQANTNLDASTAPANYTNELTPYLPPPPGASASASPTSALPSSQQGASDGKSADATNELTPYIASAPVSDKSQDASGSSADSSVDNTQATGGPSDSPPADASGTPQDSSASSAPVPQAVTPKNVEVAAPPSTSQDSTTATLAAPVPKVVTAQDMLSSYMSPDQVSAHNQEVQIGLQRQIAAFNQEQVAQKIAAAEKAIDPTGKTHLSPIQVLQFYGIKPPTNAGAMRFDSQTVNGDRLPDNAVDAAGHPITDRDQKHAWQAVGIDAMGNPKYLPIDPTLRQVTQGNRPVNYNPKNGTFSDPINGLPMKPGTVTSHYDTATGQTYYTTSTPVTEKMPDGEASGSSASNPAAAVNVASPNNIPTIAHTPHGTIAKITPPPTNGGQILKLDDRGLIPPSAKASQQVINAANSIVKGQDPATIKPDRLAQMAKELATKYGYEYSPPLTGPAQGIVMKTTPVLDQVRKTMQTINDLGLRNNNTMGYLVSAYVKYNMGVASPEGTLGANIADFSLGSIVDATSALSGGSRAWTALSLAKDHTPNAWKDSPKMMYHKLEIIQDRLQDMVDEAREQGTKGGGGGHLIPPAPMNAARANQIATTPKIGDIDGGYRFRGGDPNDKANWDKVK